MKSAAHDFPARARSALNNPDPARAQCRAREPASSTGASPWSKRSPSSRRCVARPARSRSTRSGTSTTTWSASMRRVLAHGGHVHWACTPAEARAIVLDICHAAGAKRITKGKSMGGRGDRAERRAGGRGLRGDRDRSRRVPSSSSRTSRRATSSCRAIHKTKDQISDLFHAHHAKYGLTERQTEAAALVGEARAGAAREVPERGGRDYRRELPRRRDRVERHRHQRGQRRPHQHACPACTS